MPEPSSNPPGQRLVSTFATDPEMAELVGLFVGEIPDRIRAIQEAWSSGSLAELARVAHQLKGSCGGYGFPSIGDQAARVEGLIKSGTSDLESVRHEVDGLVELCRRAMT